MADIAQNDVTYVLQEGTQKSGPDCRYSAVFTATFGNGALTYPTGGVPLLRAKMGCPTRIEECTIMDMANANGFIYKYDPLNNKVRIYQGDNDGVADGALVELAGGSAAPAAATIRLKVVGW